jgi:hypothetical protein
MDGQAGPWHTAEGLSGQSCLFGHAINSHARLEAFIAGPGNVAEGDVLLGRLDGGIGTTAIMAHPPRRDSDLSFDEWVRSALVHGHSIKVDLKQPEVLDAVLDTLRGLEVPEGRLILNADTVRGPDAEPPRLETACIERCRSAFPGALISVGSTVAPRARSYEPAHVQALAAGARPFAPLVTLCLRADLALAHPEALAPLTAEGFLLTLWNAPGDPTSPEGLLALFPHALLDLRSA